ncbi:hypothetical protein AZE42_02447, partial [Rhizopogon vesiculosus]
LQITTGKVPWSEFEDEFDVVVKIGRGLVPLRPEECDIKDSLWEFIQQCWEFIPEDRPTSLSALDFAEIEFRATLRCSKFPTVLPSQGASSHTLVSVDHSPLIPSSPAPSRIPSPVATRDSRRLSILDQVVSVTVPWNNTGSVRPGASASLLSDAPASLTSSLDVTSALESDVVASSTTVPAMTFDRLSCRTPLSTSPKQPLSPALSSTSSDSSSIISTTATSAPFGLFNSIVIGSIDDTSASTRNTPMQLPSQSAWARRTPQSNSASAPLPRSQSPGPPHTTIAISHSGYPSALDQGVSGGVTVPRNDGGSVRPGLISIYYQHD